MFDKRHKCFDLLLGIYQGIHDVDKLDGIDGGAVDFDPPVKVRPADPAGRACEAEQLPLFDLLAGFGFDFAQMGIN